MELRYPPNGPPSSRMGRLTPRRLRQRGAEVVEFALLASLIFLLLFAIIEFSIAMYNQGTLVHAARAGAREASLYWIDVSQLLPTSDPEDDQRMKPSEVEATISNYIDRFIISFTGEAPTMEIALRDVSIPNADTLVVNAGDNVSVDLSFTYRAPVTAALANILDQDMTSRAVMRVE